MIPSRRFHLSLISHPEEITRLILEAADNATRLARWLALGP
jgi:hypothetical protein